ncbi:sporulation protein YqfD, partial [Bacillus altitudinis]
MRRNIERIRWVGVEVKGRRFEMKVVEKNEAEKEKYRSGEKMVGK